MRHSTEFLTKESNEKQNKLPVDDHTTSSASALVTGMALQVNVPSFLQETVANIIAFLPRLLGALLILIIGWILGVIIGKAVKSAASSADVDKHAKNTPLGRMSSGGSQNPVSKMLGKIAAWFIYALAILAAANALAIPILSNWIARAITYIPQFIAGLLIIVFGFIVANIVSDVIENTTQSSYASKFGKATEIFLDFNFIVIGLATMGVEVEILYFFARAFAWGLAAAVAIGVGLAVGLGGQDYVSNNIGKWAGQAKSKASEAQSSSGNTTSNSSTRPSHRSGSESSQNSE